MPDSLDITTYPLAPALGARLVGRSLVSLAVAVLVATLVTALVGSDWAFVGILAVVGVVLVAGWAWWLLRVAWALRLTTEGYAVRLLGGVGAMAGSWIEVAEVTASSPGGQPCLVLRLRDDRITRLPMAALGADRDAVALDVQRRVRDAHSRSTDS